MIFSIASYWAIFAGSCIDTYPLVVIISIILYVFFKQKWGNEIINWLYVFNTIVLWVSLANLIFYAGELFIAWYGQNQYEWYAFSQNRANIFSPYGWSYWLMMFCNVVSPQMFWFKKLRRNIVFTFFMSIIVNIGMWYERFVIIVTSTYRDYLPSSWSTYYSPSIYEIGFYLGTFGLFFTCFFLFAKYFPVIAVAEIKSILKTSGENYKRKVTDIEKADSEKFYVEKVEHAH